MHNFEHGKAESLWAYWGPCIFILISASGEVRFLNW